MPARPQMFHRALCIALVVVLCDQLTKAFAADLLASQAVRITAFLQFALGFNRGAAFGFLHDAGGWQRYFLIFLAAGISIVLIIWLWKIRRRTAAVLRLGLALLLGGAVGNLCDRIWNGYVVDFIVLHYRGWYFPAFNIADIAITLGAALLILDGVKPAPGTAQPAANE